MLISDLSNCRAVRPCLGGSFVHTLNNLPSSRGTISSHEAGATRAHVQALLSRSARLARVPAPPRDEKRMVSFVCLTAEPEDAKLTGATRSLSRRLLALNMRDDS